MFGKILDVIDKILTFFEDWTLFISVFVCLIALFVNVVLRYGHIKFKREIDTIDVNRSGFFLETSLLF